jgi:hypothetical protein
VVNGRSFAAGRHCRSIRAVSGGMERPTTKDSIMRNLLLVLGLLALAIGVLWIGQGTGMVAWPRTSFMINQIEWAGYGAALGAVGLILIWQSKR